MQIVIDGSQFRLSSELYSTLCGGEDWDLPASTNVYLDGISDTIMLLPAPNTAAWSNTNSGICAKLGRSDFTLTDPSHWIDNLLNAGDGPFMQYQDASNPAGVGGVTTTSMIENQPMFVEQFGNLQTSASADGNLHLGWTPDGGTTGVTLRIFPDGTTQVYKNSTFVGQYSVAGQSSEYGSTTGSIPGTQPSSYVGYYLIPFRGRDLLVLSSMGGGFVHTFDDIPEGTSNAIITPAVPFGFTVVAGYSPNIRISKLQFVSSGTLVGKRSYWKAEPPDMMFTGYLYQDTLTKNLAPVDTATYPVMVMDGINPSTAYVNNTNGLRLAVTLEQAGGVSSPFVYGARAARPAEIESTPNESLDVTSFTTRLSFRSGDSIKSCEGTIELAGPNAIEAAGLAGAGGGQQIDVTNYRPLQLIDAVAGPVLTGLLVHPKRTASSGMDAASVDLNTRIEAELRDFGQIAEDYLFGDPIPLDGMDLASAYELVGSMIGVSTRVSTSFSSFILPSAGSPTSSKDFNVLIEPGDKGIDWLDRLHKTYAGTSAHFVAPDGKFSLLDSSDMPSAPVLTIYDDIDFAIATDATLTPATAQAVTFRSYDTTSLEPEANVTYVTGFDVRTKRPIVVHKEDTASSNPTTSSSLRPANWLGFKRCYAWVDSSLTTLAICQAVCNLLHGRLSQQRSVIEFELEFAPELVAYGQLVLLKFKAGGSVLARIRSYDASVLQVDPTRPSWRPTHYCAQVGTDISPLHTMGTRLHDIRQEWALRAASKKQVWQDGIVAGRGLARATIGQQSL